MPQYRPDPKGGLNLVLDERTIADDCRFPEVYPEGHAHAGQPHPKAGEIDYAMLKENGIPLVLEATEKPAVPSYDGVPGVALAPATVATMRSEIKAELQVEFEDRMNDAIAKAVSAALKGKPVRAVKAPKGPKANKPAETREPAGAAAK